MRILAYVYPALLITKATGTIDDTSTSSGGDGERLESVSCAFISKDIAIRDEADPAM